MTEWMGVLAGVWPGAEWLVVWLVKATLVLGAVYVLARVLERAAASTRHLLWAVGLTAAVLLPATGRWLRVEVPVLPARAIGVAVQGTASVSGAEAAGGLATLERAAPQVAGGSLPAAAAVAERTPGLPFAPRGAALVWLAVVGLLLARLLVGGYRLHRIVRRAEPLNDSGWNRPLFEAADRLDLADAPPVRRSEHVTMPLACGVTRPVIIVPASADEWTTERRRAVLFHELAHIRRGDVATQLLGRVACALLWFHPLVWVAARRMRAEAERACDDLVLTAGTRASDYADHLLQIVTGARRMVAPVVAIPMAQRKEFESRLISILDASVRRGAATRRQVGLVVALVIAFALPVSGFAPVPVRVPDAAPTETQASEASVADAAAATADGVVEAGEVATPAVKEKPLAKEVEQLVDGVATSLKDAASALLESRGVLLETKAGQDPDRVAPPQLIRVLRDESPDVRRTAAWALAEYRDPATIAALSTTLVEDADTRVREMAAWALGEIELAAGVPALGRAVQSDAEVNVRRTAAWALGQIEHEDAVDALGAALARDADREARSMAAWALGQIESRRAVAALARGLADGDREVRVMSAWALGQIEMTPAPDALLAAVRDADPGVRRAAIWALGQIEDPASADVLAAALAEADPEVRDAVVWALLRIDAPAARPAILPLLEDPDPKVRERAVRALAGRSGSSPWPWPMPMPKPRPFP